MNTLDEVLERFSPDQTVPPNHHKPVSGVDEAASRYVFDEAAFLAKIPYAKGTAEYAQYAKMIPSLKERTEEDIPNVVATMDLYEDSDDGQAVITLCGLDRMGIIKFVGLILNLRPNDQRAIFGQTMVDLLACDVTIAIGTDGTTIKRFLNTPSYSFANKSFKGYYEKEHGDRPLLTGDQLMEQLTQPGKPKITLLNTSSFRDISGYLEKNSDEFLREHIKKFVSQGGYELDVDRKPFKLMAAKNNEYDEDAANNYIKHVGKLNIPSCVSTKHVANAAAMNVTKFEKLNELGPVGEDLKWLLNKIEFKFLLDSRLLPFMPRLNFAWWLEIRGGISVESEQFKEMVANPPTFRETLRYARNVMYDGVAAILGVLDEKILKALGIISESPTLHQVYGESSTNLGGINREALKKASETFLFGSLRDTYLYAKKLMPGPMKYEVEQYSDTDLSVFPLQLQFLQMRKRMQNKMEEQIANAIKEQGVDNMEEPMKAAMKKPIRNLMEAEMEKTLLERLGGEALLDASGNPMLSPTGKPYPKIPKGIPYEILQEEYIRGESPGYLESLTPWTDHEEDNHPYCRPRP